jgi:hypothetical protein
MPLDAFINMLQIFSRFPPFSSRNILCYIMDLYKSYAFLSCKMQNAQSSAGIVNRKKHPQRHRLTL